MAVLNTEFAHFEEVLRDADPKDNQAFKAIISDALYVLRVQRKDMAEMFDVSAATITRWVQGQNVPHPAMRRVIYAALRKRVGALSRSIQHQPSTEYSTMLRRAAG